MAILDTDTANGYLKAPCPPQTVCPGSAGYVFDNNDVGSALVGTTLFKMNIWNSQYGFPSFHTGFASSHLSADTAINVSTEKLLFGKNAFKLLNSSSYPELTVTTPSISSQTFTIGFWINTTNNYYNQLIIYSGNVGSNTYISLGARITVSVNGSIILDQSGTLDIPADGNWHFVRLINLNGTMQCYVDGTLKRQWSFAVNPTSLIFNLPSGATYTYLRDIVVSKVARYGSFVPTNIIGY